MNLQEYSRFDGLRLAELVRRGEVTPEELSLLAAEAVRKVNPALNAVVEVFQDRVEGLDEATLSQGPFRGVPFLLKDLGSGEKGRKQECGSRLLEGSTSEDDAYLTLRFRQAGLNLLGRTTCPEFGFTITTESVLWGQTHNPWNLARTPGGSSGGAAACVSAGVVPVAHATDGAGSIRVPASVCGLVGLKPSRGRISLGPYDNDITDYRAVEGFLTRTVRDTAALLDTCHGPFPGEAIVICPPSAPYLPQVGAPLRKMRISLSLEPWGQFRPDPAIADQVRSIARLCEDMGHEVVEATPAIDFDRFFEAFRGEYIVKLPSSLGASATKMNRAISPETVEPIVLEAYGQASRMSATEHLERLSMMNAVTRQIGVFFETYDLLLTPTLAVPPPLLGTHSTNRSDLTLDEFFARFFSANPYTPLFNFTGIPAISLPLCQTGDGLPVGVQLAARFGREDRLIRMASALETAAPWADRLPPVHVSRAEAASS